jgi:hypothetical protein
MNKPGFNAKLNAIKKVEGFAKKYEKAAGLIFNLLAEICDSHGQMKILLSELANEAQREAREKK